jgi:DNA-directed RNA polymerase specialized sigma24 family protein
MEKSIDQQQLMVLLKARDIRAVEMLYDQYSCVLYGVIFWITNDEKKSEDVLFKTFTYIWNHYSSFDVSVHNVCLWMVNIARKFSFEILSPEERFKLANASALLNPDNTPEETRVLSAAFYRGMSIEMMAERFNCSETKIRTLLNKAVNHLKKEYVAK